MKKKIALGLVAVAVLMGGGAQAAQAAGQYYFFSTESACLGAMDRMERGGFEIFQYCVYQPQQGSNLAWYFGAR